MQAVVLAAGEGPRMRPLSERWPKPVLPIDGRPVIAFSPPRARGGRSGGVTVVTGYLAEQVEELLGDGAAFGVELRYARQSRPAGSADAVGVPSRPAPETAVPGQRGGHPLRAR